ncbi:MAG: hypothetical protein J6I53_00090 [Treponema sp.]|nr:hypothetical protein [Treponema sp.]MBP3771070.1 hypothetical protein [Treponema sp.]
MKKVCIIKNITNLALFALIGLIASCGENSGLGEAVDLTAPIVTLTSHNDNDSVASTFTLKGTVWDNEAVRSLAIDFEDADIHYSITPGSSWQKKSKETGGVWTAMDDSKAKCIKSGDTWSWSIYIDTTSDKKDGFTNTTYTMSAVAVDSSGNSGKNSKVDCSLIVDENDPNVTINKPDIFTDYANISSKSTNYKLQDGNSLARLMNGDVTFSIQQGGAISFKELRVEFDNGTTEWEKHTADDPTDYTDTESIANAITGDTLPPTVYYTKTLKVNENGITDLRAVDLTVKASEWASNEKGKTNGLDTGMHIIRIVTTSLSPSNAWQRKVVGYFVWWPEADTPWVTVYQGDDSDKGNDASEVYPGSNISGSAQDDDGIKSLTYTLKKKTTVNNEDTWQAEKENISLSLSEVGGKYSAWSLVAPTLNGNYCLSVTVTDIYGTSSTTTKYFKTLDIKPPTIEFDSSSAQNASSALTSNHKITFSGLVSDDGDIDSLKVVYLNPNLSNDATNKIKYMSGTDTDWDDITSGNKDDSGNIVYDLTTDLESVENSSGKSYKFSKTFDVFTDLGIDGETKTLTAQDFVFRVVDKGGTKTVKMLSLTGDSTAPSLTFDKIVLENGGTSLTYDLTNEIPNLPVIKSGAKATLSGTWGDNSFDTWKDTSKIGKISVTWNGSDKVTVTPNANRSWSASVSDVPSDSGTIKISLSDFGGNTKAVTKSVFIESNTTKLERIGSDSDDGSYKKDSEILITLEFTKNTTWSGSEPSLTLNNGGVASFDSGNGTAKHIFKYTVKGNESESTEQLFVKTINQAGTTWTEASGATFTVEIPEDTKTLKTRNICVDTKAPTISSITAITPAGAYKANSDIIIMMEFSEDVSVVTSSGVLKDKLKINFKDSLNTTDASASGSKFVIFTYTVGENDNSSKLEYYSIEHDDVTITDEAGNELTSWEPESTFNKAIVIDTKKPNPPTVNPAWGSAQVVISESGSSFTISSDESDTTIEYTLDGSNYQNYKTGETIKLTNNGKYTVSARQTDKAGNISDESTAIIVTVDKGELFTSLSATTYSGTYSKQKGGEVIGIINFRKSVKIAKGAKVTLNVKRGTQSTLEVPITECVSDDGEASTFHFTYTIEDGDSIENNGMLDVTEWSFEEITLDSSTVSMKYEDKVSSGSGKAFTDNREIYILTGKPTVQSVELKGEGSAAILKITFDREITKLSGNITFTQDTSSYRVPAVLTASEYNSIPTAAQSSYSKGMNGATLGSDSTLTNDTSTKYVLDYTKDIDDSTLVGYFTAANLHVVSIPIVASAVEANGTVLTATLGSTYTLPTKGATYTLSIPANAVTDEAQNNNEEYTTDGTSSKPHLVAEGVESPEIRINKESQKITISNANTPTTTASVNTPATANMKISCRTPGATIYYAKTTDANAKSATSTVNTTITVSQTAKPKVSSLPTYSSSTAVTLTGTLGTAVSSYDTATGMKYAIAAYAKKDSYESDKSYEYATRTVLKLNISAYGQGSSQCAYSDASDVTENGTTLTYGKLRIWIQGGDATSGGNSLDPFPLSWGESTNFKLMEGSHTGNSMQGYYYWVTWDLNATAYHGFVLGNVHDFGTSGIGPSIYYATDCGWTKYKSSYPLYPGETLEMITSYYGGNTFQFNYKLKCTVN